MKKLTIILGILAVFTFCTKENESSELISVEEEIKNGLITETPGNSTDYLKFEGIWKLVKMSGTHVNIELSGEEMTWQEYYLFDDNGKFKKSMEREGIITEINGVYFSKEYSDGTFLILTYESEHAIIGSCSSNLQEALWIKSDLKLTGIWDACDGPRLEYNKIVE